MEKRKILVLDDEKKLCHMVKQRLERGGEYDVTVAYSGAEGIEKAKVTTFDLVITDFNMPGMDGNAVVEALKAMIPQLPVVLFSVYHDDAATITPDILSKADGVISKPINHKQLFKTLEDVLARSRGGR